MAQTTKAAIDALISTNLADNTTEDITPLDVRQVESAMSDSYQIRSVEVSGSITALIDGDYINTATATYTDPTPAQGKGFTVTVRNGTATVGGTAYGVTGTVIKRIFHSGSWANYPTFPNNVYAVAGLTVNNSNPRTPTIYPVHSFLATAPTVDEDSSFGYLVGSRVVAQDTQIEYLCIDNTDEAAVWIPMQGRFTPNVTETQDDVFSNVTMSEARFFVDGDLITIAGSFQADADFTLWDGRGVLQFDFPTTFRSSVNDQYGILNMRSKVAQEGSDIINLSITATSSNLSIFCTPESAAGSFGGQWFDYSITFNTLFQAPE
jgi:hypothetical protein